MGAQHPLGWPPPKPSIPNAFNSEPCFNPNTLRAFLSAGSTSILIYLHSKQRLTAHYEAREAYRNGTNFETSHRGRILLTHCLQAWTRPSPSYCAGRSKPAGVSGRAVWRGLAPGREGSSGAVSKLCLLTLMPGTPESGPGPSPLLPGQPRGSGFGSRGSGLGEVKQDTARPLGAGRCRALI